MTMTSDFETLPGVSQARLQRLEQLERELAAMRQAAAQPRRLTDDQVGQVWFEMAIPGLRESDARRLIRAAERLLNAGR